MLRSFININVGWNDYYYYIDPPSFPLYTDVYDDPRYYNIGYTYYDPEFQSYYVAPYSYAYQPYDYYQSSYYYDDPYYFDDPTDDFLTVRIFASNSGGGFLSRMVGGLLSYGYDEGYRDGLYAREQGYAEAYYEDPFVYYEEQYTEEEYETYPVYQPYAYSNYESRRCLSEGYDLGYYDALYGENEYYPYEDAQIDLVSLWIGASFQIA